MKFNMFVDTGHHQQGDDGGRFQDQTLVTFGKRNSKGYLLQPGCCDAWIQESGGTVPMLRQHDSMAVIGEMRGLHVQGDTLRAGGSEFFAGIQAAGETEILIDRGVLQGLSIGFDADPDDVTVISGKQGYEVDFSAIAIHEVSVVLSPADKTAIIQSADGQLAELHTLRAASAPTEGIEMSENTVTVELIQDRIDKKIEMAQEAMSTQIDAKFAELDSGIENQITQAFDRARLTQGPKDPWVKFEKNGAAAFRCEVPAQYQQGANYASPTTGGPHDAVAPLPNYVEVNFMRRYVSVVPVSGSAVIVPKLSAIAWATKGAIGSGAAETGGMSDSTKNVKTVTAKVTMPTEMDSDVVAFRNAIVGQFMRSYQNQVCGELIGLGKGVASTRQVNTGVAADYAAANAIAPNIRTLCNKVSREYWVDGDMLLLMSPYGENKLAGDISGGFRWDETARLNMFYGMPVRATSLSLDAGSTASDISAVAGNWRIGCTLYERENVDIMAFQETDPGYITFYGEGRYVATRNFGDALAALKTSA